MGDTIFQAICRIGIFMICAQTFVHFCPKGSYEKYLKMLVSIMVLVQVLSPLGALLQGEEEQVAQMQSGEWLEEALMQSMDEMLQGSEAWLGEMEETLEVDSTATMDVTADSEVADEKSGQIVIEPIAPIQIGQ